MGGMKLSASAPGQPRGFFMPGAALFRASAKIILFCAGATRAALYPRAADYILPPAAPAGAAGGNILRLAAAFFPPGGGNSAGETKEIYSGFFSKTIDTQGFLVYTLLDNVYPAVAVAGDWRSHA